MLRYSIEAVTSNTQATSLDCFRDFNLCVQKNLLSSVLVCAAELSLIRVLQYSITAMSAAQVNSSKAQKQDDTLLFSQLVDALKMKNSVILSSAQPLIGRLSLNIKKLSCSITAHPGLLEI